ncbi:hypothetical protein PUN28_006297 [Cardiocondyla obscurior]|uniref:Uncharacterized protein n=1 Tax=Cardiocondyla obscurior TaxID=286306 RepID=A0AAW2G9Z9_9HYME
MSHRKTTRILNSLGCSFQCKTLFNQRDFILVYCLVMYICIVASGEHFTTLNTFPDRLAVFDNYAMSRNVQMRYYVTLQGVPVEKTFIAHLANRFLIFKQLSTLQTRHANFLGMLPLIVIE